MKQRDFDTYEEKIKIEMLWNYLALAMRDIRPSRIKNCYRLAAAYGKSEKIKEEDFDLIKDKTIDQVMAKFLL